MVHKFPSKNFIFAGANKQEWAHASHSQHNRVCKKLEKPAPFAWIVGLNIANLSFAPSFYAAKRKFASVPDGLLARTAFIAYVSIGFAAGLAWCFGCHDNS